MPFDEKSWNLPKAEGLYNPALEKDACGVGFIVNIEGKRTHKVNRTFEIKQDSTRVRCSNRVMSSNDLCGSMM